MQPSTSILLSLLPLLAAASPQAFSVPTNFASIVSQVETDPGVLSTAFNGVASQYSALGSSIAAAFTTNPAFRSEASELSALASTNPAAASAAAMSILSDSGVGSLISQISSAQATAPSKLSSGASSVASTHASTGATTGATAASTGAAATAGSSSSTSHSNPAAQATAMPVLGMGAAIFGLVGAVAAL